MKKLKYTITSSTGAKTVPSRKGYFICPLTKRGEGLVQMKINPEKRHSVNNTIIGWNIYKDGKYEYILFN
jgi:hypothetical protein